MERPVASGCSRFRLQNSRCESVRDCFDCNQDFLKQLGADMAIDYKTQKFEEIAKDVPM